MSSTIKQKQDNRVVNAITVDVEDYFQVSAFEPYIRRCDWDKTPGRVEGNTNRILDIFDDCGVHGTFFMLGWVAERYPGLIKRIVDEGHELASHGYSHVRVTCQTREEFRDDATRTRILLENIGGCQVSGYRAASFSINGENLWALDELQGAGYRYSSSIYPMRHDIYGMPTAPRFAFYPNGEDGLIEIPITTLSIFNQRLPSGGGGYFRLLPYALSRWSLRRINNKERQPCVFYFHPWEIDPAQPRQYGLSYKTRFRHYVNLKRMECRLLSLLKDFRWDRMDRIFLNTANSGGHGDKIR
jgi:polysaccharide deacetylase family protein (PEP-CTERM system associated)